MGHPVLIKLSLQIRAGVPLRPRGGLGADDVPVCARGAIPLPRLPTRKLVAPAVHGEGAWVGLRRQHLQGARRGGLGARAARQKEESCRKVLREVA